MRTPTRHERPRSRVECLRDVDYAVRLGVVHQRLYARLDHALKLVQVFGGSAAVGAVISGQPLLVGITGGLVALAASVSLVFDFARAAWQHNALVARCNAITIRALEHPDMDADAITAALTRATDIELDQVEALRLPCYNEVQRRHGLLANVQPLTRWQRLLAAIA